MEIVYIPGDSFAFKTFVDEHYADSTVQLENIEGHNRWVVTKEDGTKYIVRPEECEPRSVMSRPPVGYTNLPKEERERFSKRPVK